MKEAEQKSQSKSGGREEDKVEVGTGFIEIENGKTP